MLWKAGSVTPFMSRQMPTALFMLRPQHILRGRTIPATVVRR